MNHDLAQAERHTDRAWMRVSEEMEHHRAESSPARDLLRLMRDAIQAMAHEDYLRNHHD